MLLSSWFFISIFSHNYHSYPWTNLISVVPVNWKLPGSITMASFQPQQGWNSL